jgi:hypothetical protein
LLSPSGGNPQPGEHAAGAGSRSGKLFSGILLLINNSFLLFNGLPVETWSPR